MENNEGIKKKKYLFFNKYTLTFIFIYFLLGVGLTYSYFAYQVQNDSVIGKLRKSNLNFAIVSLADELLVAYYNDSIYLDYYEEINTFLESLLLKQSSIKWK